MRGSSTGNPLSACQSHKGGPACRVQPNQAFQIAVKRMFDIQMHRGCVRLFEQQNTARKHRGKDHAHGRACLDPAKAANALNRDNRNHRRSRRAQQALAMY